jgi:hypothetical protein
MDNSCKKTKDCKYYFKFGEKRKIIKFFSEFLKENNEIQFKENIVTFLIKIQKLFYFCKVVKVILTKNTTLQKMEQLSLKGCNCIRN